MLDLKPFIHVFNRGGNFYIFDVNTNKILQVEKEVYIIMEKYLKGKLKPAADNYKKVLGIIERMEQEQLFSNARVLEIEHPDNEILEYHLKNKVIMISLQVTQQCNLRCSYCAYSGKYKNRTHSGKKMNFDTAKKAIDFLLEHSKDLYDIAVTFYGGEPLMEFGLIKQCIEYAEARAEGKNLIFSITTNATLLTKKIIGYFAKHCVNMLISLDGPKEIHNSSRVFSSGGGSFEHVMNAIRIIRKDYPEYLKNISLNAVVNQNSDFHKLDSFFSQQEEIKELKLNMQFVKTLYAKENMDVSKDFYTEYCFEVFKLYLSKLGRLDKIHVSRLAESHFSSIENIAASLKYTRRILPSKGHPSGPCIPGAHRPFIDTEGNIFPCERVSESSNAMCIGNIFSGFDIEKARALLNIGKVTEKACKTCWAFTFCNLCAAYADDTLELSGEQRASYCDGVKANTESLLKDYCILKELGLDFEYNAALKGGV